MPFRTRGYLPHFESDQRTYFVTFRLEDSLPSETLLRWKNELHLKQRSHLHDIQKLHLFQSEYESRIQSYLDSGTGECWLKESRIAAIVDGALRHFDKHRYLLHAWTIMPNHVHALLTVDDAFRLSTIVHSWKGFSANQANRLLGRCGSFWQREYYDRAIRSMRHFEYSVRYIVNNPVKAGLCAEPFQWPWTRCSEEIQYMLKRFFV